MRPDLKLRKARPSDLPALLALHHLSAVLKTRRHYSRAEVAGFLADVEVISSEVLRGRTYHVAEIGGRIVAAAGWTTRGNDPDHPDMRRRQSPVATLQGVMIHPDHACSALTRTMLDLVEAEASARGRALDVEVCATRGDVAFYQRRGYQALENTWLDLSNGTHFEIVRMRKRLLAVTRSRTAYRDVEEPSPLLLIGRRGGGDDRFAA